MVNNNFPDFKSFSSKGITEFFVDDIRISSTRRILLEFIEKIRSDAHDLFVSIPVEPDVINAEVCKAAQNIFCSLTLNLTEKRDNPNVVGKYFLDKKLYSKKASLLNEFYLVWGFSMDFAVTPGDSMKLFRERLDFAVSLYPNHIEFPQLQSSSGKKTAPTAVFSGTNIAYAADVAFACRTFYSSGRAVPWFYVVLRPLRIKPFDFFSDFAEWQNCNNCDLRSEFSDLNVSHEEIEKMQLAFLELKYEEKGLQNLFPVVKDMVRINGALSRVAGEGKETVLETYYSPDDILGPDSLNIPVFAESVCMDRYKLSVFAGQHGPDYKIL